VLSTRSFLPAIAFGLSGALSAWALVFKPDGPPWLWGWPVALPFAVLSVALWVRSLKLAPIIVVLDAVAWQAAFRAAIALNGPGDYAAVCIGGFIGAAGVVACMGLIRRELLARAGWAGLLGAVSALPFGLWLHVDSGANAGSPHLPLLILCFAVWQIAIGLFLQHSYSRSRR
jgi:hypothetical protein